MLSHFASRSAIAMVLVGYSGLAVAQSVGGPPTSVGAQPEETGNTPQLKPSLRMRHTLGLPPYYSSFELGVRALVYFDSDAWFAAAFGAGADAAYYANDWLGVGIQYMNLATYDSREGAMGRSESYLYRQRRWLTPFVELRTHARQPITFYARGYVGPLWIQEWDRARQALGDFQTTVCTNAEGGVDFHWIVSTRFALLVAGLWPPDSPTFGVIQQLGFEF
jgi:hypothetical protein